MSENRLTDGELAALARHCEGLADTDTLPTTVREVRALVGEVQSFRVAAGAVCDHFLVTNHAPDSRPGASCYKKIAALRVCLAPPMDPPRSCSCDPEAVRRKKARNDPGETWSICLRCGGVA